MRFGLLFTLFFGVSSQVSEAKVTPFLNNDPVILLIQGIDSDAKRIFDSISNDGEKGPGELIQKKVKSESGQFDLSCRYSESTSMASCTLKLKSGSNLKVDRENREVELDLVDLEGTDLSDQFKKDENGKFSFLSEQEDLDLSGNADSFHLQFQAVSK